MKTLRIQNIDYLSLLNIDYLYNMYWQKPICNGFVIHYKTKDSPRNSWPESIVLFLI